MNGPQLNESLINTISIQESTTMKSKNDEKYIEKLSQIESKHSLNSKGSAAAPGGLGNGRQDQLLHNPSSATKDATLFENKTKN